MTKLTISIVTPTFNEVDNIDELFRRIYQVTSRLDQYHFEFIVIDNCSIDGTQEKLRTLATQDKRVKVILNARNFGHIRSPYYGLLQASGVAVIYLASDLQDPPELIPDFVAEWEKGFKLVMAIKPLSRVNSLSHLVRKMFYRLIDKIADIDIIKDSTGFGLYSIEVLDKLRKINDPYPFLRGLICELGYEVKTLPFVQPRRFGGITKNNFYTLFDIALLGIVSHSKIPIRLASFCGLALGLLSIVTAFIFTVLKLIFWNSFPIGSAPTIIGMFFLFGMQLLFIGILGEYIASIHTYVQKRPIVVEKERINFESDAS
jgi:glycosyltransferase involved in cell wall biosynthesis